MYLTQTGVGTQTIILAQISRAENAMPRQLDYELGRSGAEQHPQPPYSSRDNGGGDMWGPEVCHLPS